MSDVEVLRLWHIATAKDDGEELRWFEQPISGEKIPDLTEPFLRKVAKMFAEAPNTSALYVAKLAEQAADRGFSSFAVEQLFVAIQKRPEPEIADLVAKALLQPAHCVDASHNRAALIRLVYGTGDFTAQVLQSTQEAERLFGHGQGLPYLQAYAACAFAREHRPDLAIRSLRLATERKNDEFFGVFSTFADEVFDTLIEMESWDAAIEVGKQYFDSSMAIQPKLIKVLLNSGQHRDAIYFAVKAVELERDPVQKMFRRQEARHIIAAAPSEILSVTQKPKLHEALNSDLFNTIYDMLDRVSGQRRGRASATPDITEPFGNDLGGADLGPRSPEL